MRPALLTRVAATPSAPTKPPQTPPASQRAATGTAEPNRAMCYEAADTVLDCRHITFRRIPDELRDALKKTFTDYLRTNG